MTWRQVLTTIGKGLTTHLKEGRRLADVKSCTVLQIIPVLSILFICIYICICYVTKVSMSIYK